MLAVHQQQRQTELQKCTLSVSVLCCESHLEFGDHAGLCVVTGTVLMDQTFSQHLSIKLLENIFVLDVLEHNHLQETDDAVQA